MTHNYLHFRPLRLTTFFILVCNLTLLTSMSGCKGKGDRWKPIQRWKKVDMDARMGDVPPIRVGMLNDRHLLIMQAPNSGWMLSIDKDERVAEGVNLFVTIRRPDPAYMYPQAIVEKQVLSDIQSDAPIVLFARLLDADEKTKNRGYIELAPVEQFEE